MKDVDRHLFFDKIKSLGIDSCLNEIPKNDLVDDMSCSLWLSVTFPDVYCYLIETPGDLRRNFDRFRFGLVRPGSEP